MAKAAATFTVSADTRLTLLWVRLIKVVAPILLPVIGMSRIERLAYWGAVRLTRFRIDGGHWRWLRPEPPA